MNKILSITITGLLAFQSSAYAQVDLDKIANKLYKRTGIPVELAQREAPYVKIEAKLGQGWSVRFDYSKDCSGAHVCTDLTISARPGKIAANWATEYAKNWGQRGSAKTGKLSDGTTIYVAGGVGSYQSYIARWERNGFVYSLGYKGNIQAYTKIANEMIKGGTRGVGPGACTAAIDQAAGKLVGDKNFQMRVLAKRHGYDDGPQSKKFSIMLVSGGARAQKPEQHRTAAIMNSPKLQQSSAEVILKNCSKVGLVNIGQDSSAYGESWAMGKNNIPFKFKCIEDAADWKGSYRNFRKWQWGEKACNI